ncbi:hypothetical protein ECDEC13C_5439 [Escherichia coli DEC13C]|nr:hypothetical protein ECDEC13C_5439 [Escherichia coli DEC13C]
MSGTGAAAIVFVLTQHLPDLISQRSPVPLVNAKIIGRFSPFLMSAIGH